VRKRRLPQIIAVAVLTAAAGAVLLAAACGGTGNASVTPGPNLGLTLTAADAARSMRSFDKAFLRSGHRGGFYRLSTAGGAIGFWKEAELIETAEDYYRYTADPAYKTLVASLCRGFVARFGTDWMYKYAGGTTGRSLGPRANDDIMWMVIAAARAYHITGDSAYRRMAAKNFNAAYGRSWSGDFGGGIWWRMATGHAYRAEKNTTTNAPAAIAACELYNDFHEQKYLTQAKALYAWVRGHLYNARSGRVYDHVRYTSNGGTRTYRTGWSYNQGTFIGAATLLYQITGDHGYYNDATRALDYTRAHMTSKGILTADGTGFNHDTGGFKGIFARWAVRFARDNGVTTYDEWFRRNAGVVWTHRNAKGLTGQTWNAPTGNGVQFSFDCSSGVAIMEALLPAAPASAPQ